MARAGRPPRSRTQPSALARYIGPEEEIALATDVARAYYIGNQSKITIAQQLGITRFQVARLLDLARSRGIVHIEIRPPGGVDRELGADLQSALGVKQAVVVSTIKGASAAEEVGRAAAAMLVDVVSPGDVLGISWSMATVQMTTHVSRLAPCTVVQLGGHMEDASGGPGTQELVRRLAEAAGGQAYPIHAPLIVGDRRTAAALKQESTIAGAVELYDELTVAVISIGAWVPSGSIIFDALTDAERRWASSAAVVGEVAGRLFTDEGEPVTELLDDRLIGVTFEQLRRVPEKIMTAHGEYRATATIAAARAGLVDRIISDRSLAEAVLASQDGSFCS